MKVAIGYVLVDGPWGGGNQFARSLAEALAAKKHEVRFDLADRDIDIILLTDPRGRSPTVSFHAGSIVRYLLAVNPRALVVQRINECDERKNTRHMNRLLRQANYVADHTVFIASWLQELAVWRRESTSSVILNGADTRIFNAVAHRAWNGSEPLRLVTHHWGGNRMKGFDVYEKLDQLMSEPQWRGRIEFTYVGNLPAGVRFANARHLAPLSGSALAAELASHHAYVTGSINEPAGMHHIEGALCGLPLIYRRSGALPEYCAGFGLPFDDADEVPELIRSMMDNYTSFQAAMPAYANTAERMCESYIGLLDDLYTRRDAILAQRQLWRSPWMVLRNQLPM
jgi:hypothetical protein